MKNFAVVVCLMAITTVVRGMDQDTIIGKYMEYLMPDVQPCSEELHISSDVASNIQRQEVGETMKQLGCLKACVMKRMQILTGLDFHLEPIFKMIDVVHADNAEDVQLVRQIAEECVEKIKGETEECEIGNKYTECYVQKLFT
ncbi:hypothetical protein ANTRET_LOCUS5417 [Anthophora retusa]